MTLIFEWDEDKANINLRKHSVRFEEAKTVFNDPLAMTFFDETHSGDEKRFISLGVSAASRVLLVVHTEHEANDDAVIIRLISCRKATVLERKTYEEGER